MYIEMLCIKKCYVYRNVMYREMLCIEKCYVYRNVMYIELLCIEKCYVYRNVMYREILWKEIQWEIWIIKFLKLTPIAIVHDNVQNT